MDTPLLRFTLAAVACLSHGAPGVVASRIAVSERADAGADEAQGFRPLKAWPAAAAASATLLGDNHGAEPPPAGVAAPPSHPAGAGVVRRPSQLRAFQGMFKEWGGVSKGGSEKEDWPEDNGVAEINQLSDECFDGVLRCSWTQTKGRILLATRDFSPGEVIFKEDPLWVVQEQDNSAAFQQLKRLASEHEDVFPYETLWYWAAVQSLTREQLKGAPFSGIRGLTPDIQRKVLLLHSGDVKEPSEAAELIAKKLAPNADAIAIERLLQVWSMNSFEFGDKPLSMALYYFSSFMSHSCLPNAIWHFSKASHILRARREIKEGDEVCISYLAENHLYQPAPERRMELHYTKGFWCDCERCKPGRTDFSRGLKCPECADGTIFANTPMGGPAEDASLLASQWAGACCDKCGHVVRNDAQAQELVEHEWMAQKLLDIASADLYREVEDLETGEAFLDTYFTQHVLADLIRERIGLFYAARKNVPDVLRQLERRVAFHEAAYPGLAVAKAWTLDALGDCLARGGEEVDPDPEEARRCYTEALETLRLLFGDKDGYDDDVAKKLAMLDRGPARGEFSK